VGFQQYYNDERLRRSNLDPESIDGSERLAVSRGIEVEGDDRNDESLEAVATTVTPTPQANTHSFFGREVKEMDQPPLVGGCCNKDDEELFDTYISDDDEEQEEEADEEPSDTADPNRPNRTTIRAEPTLALSISLSRINREKYEAFEKMRTRKKGVGIPQGMRHCTWTDPEDKTTYYFLCEKEYHVEVHTQGEEKRPYAIPSRYKVVDKTAETKEKKKAIAEAEARVAEYEASLDDAREGGTLSRRVHEILHRRRFGFTEETSRFNAGLIVFQPTVASLGFEQIFSVYLYAFLKEAGIETDSNRVYALNPKRNTMENLVLDLAADSIIWCRDSLQRSGSYFLSFDKDDCSNGKNGGCSKITSWVDQTLTSEDFPDGQVLTMPLDGDKTGDDSPDVAEGVASSIGRLDLGASVSGQTSTQDSGGGGTLLSVHKPLISLGVLNEDALNGNCTLHNVHLEINFLLESIYIHRPTVLAGLLRVFTANVCFGSVDSFQSLQI
jgi:hypothetical protein